MTSLNNSPFPVCLRFNWLIPNYCVCIVGSYFSLTCEPTLGECQIFHSMVKRQPITIRNSIQFIGDGQEQKLKKDKVIASWIKVCWLLHRVRFKWALRLRFHPLLLKLVITYSPLLSSPLLCSVLL